VEKEMCRRTPDFMLRRSLMGLTPGGMAHAAHVRKMMAELLAWDDAELEQDREQTEREAAKIGVPKAKGSPDGEGRKEATT